MNGISVNTTDITSENKSQPSRESFKSRLGFLLVAAGCAIGIGNVWRFPFMVGKNGGAIFVLFYAIFLLILGIPILTMELAVGRASKKSSVRAFESLEPKGSKWHWHGWACMAGCSILMMYYTTVSGWMTGFFCKYLCGTFEGKTGEATGQVFSSMINSPIELASLMALIVIGGTVVCSFKINSGLERVSKFMMGSLFILILILAGNSCLLPNASKGLDFYLMPNIETAKSIGWTTIISEAMNQAFFTLSVGIGSMEIFGSYMSKRHTLASESLRISLLDTFVAFSAGLIIFPACFSYGVKPDAGPALLFNALPQVFAHMPGGRLWGTLLFLFMAFASFTTVIAVFENIIASFMDHFGWSRIKASLINGAIILAGSMPCVLGFNVLKDYNPLPGMNILDAEDFIVSTFLLPFGACVFLFFCVTRWGWGFKNYLTEANTGEGFKIPSWARYYFRFLLPLVILFILFNGLYVAVSDMLAK